MQPAREQSRAGEETTRDPPRPPAQASVYFPNVTRYECDPRVDGFCYVIFRDGLFFFQNGNRRVDKRRSARRVMVALRTTPKLIDVILGFHHATAHDMRFLSNLSRQRAEASPWSAAAYRLPRWGSPLAQRLRPC